MYSQLSVKMVQDQISLSKLAVELTMVMLNEILYYHLNYKWADQVFDYQSELTTHYV